MAVAVRRDTRMRVSEYKEWVAAQPEGERWELIDGAPVMMAPAKDRHQPHRLQPSSRASATR